ncbi:hypothetical protein FNV43_RR14876 [Rhamnella rubrinervis]|uniref:Uncharacterized protein n=1 Tax=Rhamnella rubrinervis TaxID=2594499 RepID=A0A8K0H3Q0_9ROSA|nr:hypothetical protein FNV43_RR14876 [Rhamnella rubrinervis]
MPSKLPFFTSFMEKTSKPRSGTGTTRESDVVKAAAWAWYQHGSGSEAKSMLECDVKRSHHVSTPSRYKLEAIRIAKESSVGSITPNAVHRAASDLLDTYEIESISRKLDGLIESSGGDRHSVSKRFLPVRYGGDHGLKDVSAEGETMKKKKKKLMKGFWLRHAVACGTREDVVETRALGDGRPRPEKSAVPVVRMANCRPRANHAW